MPHQNMKDMTMIKGVVPGAASRIEPLRTKSAEQGSAAAQAAGVSSQSGPRDAEPTLASRLVGDGPPVDLDKVAALRAKIADGNYAIDPRAIAEKMIEQDLDSKGVA